MAASAIFIHHRHGATSAANGEATQVVARLDTHVETSPEPAMVVPQNGTRIGAQVPFTTHPVTNPVDPTALLRLPDGRYVPALNGIEKPQPMVWQHGNFTAIVATERTQWRGLGELDWYVHEDGTRSTTLMTGVDGTPQPVTIVLHATNG
ncbi:MAG: hypothetical protein KDC95_03605 [Planctomycetes bacterium]|nr:hypothetical protein [Planctomycetota bacterium]